MKWLENIKRKHNSKKFIKSFIANPNDSVILKKMGTPRMGRLNKCRQQWTIRTFIRASPSSFRICSSLRLA